MRASLFMTASALIVLSMQGAKASELRLPSHEVQVSSQSHVQNKIPDAQTKQDILGGTTLNAGTAGLEYAFGRDEKPKNWHFLYGPLHSEHKSVQYNVRGRNGMLVFSCDSSGREEMVLGIAGLQKPVGTSYKFDVSVSDIGHPMNMLAANNPSTMRETIFYATGDNVIGLLRTISMLTENTEGAISFTDGDRTLSLPSPSYRDYTVETLNLCVKWYDNHMKKIQDDSKQLSQRPPQLGK